MLEELPRRLGVALDEAAELPHGRDEGLEIALCGDRRGAHAIAHERDLAEVVSRAEDGQILPVSRDSGRAVGDDEEPDPSLVSLFDDDRTGRKVAVREGACEPVELLLIEA